MRQVVLCYGDTGSGKTHLLSTAARGYYEATGRLVRLVTAESAQSQSQMADLIAAGIVQPWFLDSSRLTPFERLWQACLGYWPLDVNEPLSPMVEAFTYRYVAKCDKCATTPYDSPTAPQPAAIKDLKCPKCKDALLVRTIRVPNPRNGIEKVGMYLFETLHEYSDMMMRNMAERNAKGEAGLSPQDKTGGEVGLRFKDGDMWIGTNAQTHYLTAQTQIKARVDESKHLLGVDYVLWSAVKADDRDKDNKRQGRVFGPKAAGQAATSYIPQWFGPTLATQIMPASANGNKGDEYRLYTSTYFQTWDSLDKNVPNLANNRIPPHALKDFPAYYTIDRDDRTILWKVLQEIDKRQGLKPLPPKLAAQQTK